MASATSVAATMAAGTMTAAAGAMTASGPRPVAAAAMAGPIAATVAGTVSRRPVDVDVPIDLDVPIDMDVPIDHDVAVVPAMPTGAAAPADPAPPGKATPIPTWAAPARSVPAVVATTPEKSSLVDLRGLGQRGPRRECANVHRRLGGQGELSD
jgi:hypothetical protein